MKKILATSVAALTIAALSFGAIGAAEAAPAHHSAHWGQHQVCKITTHHHHKVKTCHWVKK